MMLAGRQPLLHIPGYFSSRSRMPFKLSIVQRSARLMDRALHGVSWPRCPVYFRQRPNQSGANLRNSAGTPSTTPSSTLPSSSSTPSPTSPSSSNSTSHTQSPITPSTPCSPSSTPFFEIVLLIPVLTIQKSTP